MNESREEQALREMNERILGQGFRGPIEGRITVYDNTETGRDVTGEVKPANTRPSSYPIAPFVKQTRAVRTPPKKT